MEWSGALPSPSNPDLQERPALRVAGRGERGRGVVVVDGLGGERPQQAQSWWLRWGCSVRLGPTLGPAALGSLPSVVSDIFSQIMSTRRSKVCLTLILSLALVSKNSKPERQPRNGWRVRSNRSTYNDLREAHSNRKNNRHQQAYLNLKNNIWPSHLVDQPAACLCLQPQSSRPPCHTCSPPEGPGHCPRSRSWSGLTCKDSQ